MELRAAAHRGMRCIIRSHSFGKLGEQSFGVVMYFITLLSKVQVNPNRRWQMIAQKSCAQYRTRTLRITDKELRLCPHILEPVG